MTNKLLAAVMAVSLSFGFSAAANSNQAHAASLSDLFGGAETQGQQKFLKVEQAFSVEPSQSGNQVNISLNITPEHYLYKDKLKLKLPEGVTASTLKFSHAPQTIDDPNFGKVAVFKQPQVTATATLTNTTSAAIKEDITVTWQGCAEAGLCYPPQRETLSINLPASAATASGQTTSSSSTNKTTDKATTSKNSDLTVNYKTNADALETNSKSNESKHISDKLAVNSNNSSNNDNSITKIQAATNGTDIGINGTALGGAENNDLADDELNGSLNNNPINDPETNNSVINPGNGNEFGNADAQEGLDAANTGSGLGLNANGVVDQDPFGLAEHPWLALLLLFLAGLGLAFTPCVLPMLPIVSNIVARQHTPTAKKGLILSGSYALGVAIAYGLLGAIIAIFGQQLGIIGWLQNPVILLAFAAVFVLLALYMLEVIRIPVPNAIRQKTQAVGQAGDKYLGSTLGSFIAGLLSALVVSPCVSAPLFGALLAVSTIGNPLLGFAALFMLGFGLSAPLMILGASQGNLMPQAGEWMVWVKQGFALLLFAVALLLVERVLISPIMLMLWAVWFMVVAIWAWHWKGKGQLFTKPLGVILGVWSIITLVGAAAGSQDSWQPLAVFSQPSATILGSSSDINGSITNGTVNSSSGIHSNDLHIYTLDELIPIIEQNPRVLVDVTAEWCVECRIMDKTLFTNRPTAMQQWQMVRLDVTDSNEESARILSELSLFGPPALLYFVDGKLQVQQVGTVERNEFEQTLAKLN